MMKSSQQVVAMHERKFYNPLTDAPHMHPLLPGMSRLGQQHGRSREDALVTPKRPSPTGSNAHSTCHYRSSLNG